MWAGNHSAAAKIKDDESSLALKVLAPIKHLVSLFILGNIMKIKQKLKFGSNLIILSWKEAIFGYLFWLH